MRNAYIYLESTRLNNTIEYDDSLKFCYSGNWEVGKNFICYEKLFRELATRELFFCRDHM